MTGILFTARLGSNRLPQKHLIEVYDKTFIEWLVERFKVVFKQEIENQEVKLIIATSNEPLNRKFEEVFAGSGVNVFYGSIDNIPLRHLQCADFFKLDQIISIDGDDILCSATAAKVIYSNQLQHPEKDIVTVTGLPLGMNSSGYNVPYLRSCMASSHAKTNEVGWGRVFTNPNKLEIKVGNWDIYDKLRFTLDYEDDASFFSAVIDYLKDDVLTIGDEKLFDVVKQQQFDKINSHLFDIYWENYNALKESEETNG